MLPVKYGDLMAYFDQSTSGDGKNNNDGIFFLLIYCSVSPRGDDVALYFSFYPIPAPHSSSGSLTPARMSFGARHQHYLTLVFNYLQTHLSES